ncbi:SnoaL-like polyketide cyclase [Nocardioides terrae]|uniref:SnoaL-like polyketide cyclase n=1 Tax=Nocardioides terrae TaxID=574651 RepID=A0A1I1K6I7_9ACTN|nr:ester cyclase [Nocardioides terrae]SFC56597.1 SnoaL-like polyketide cyclase [Nocardioides terrae]
MALDPIAYRPYADPDEFIREVTDLIWVQRDVNHIVENYEPDSIVHGGLGTTTDRAGVIEGSLMRIAESPHHVGQAEDVVWEARGDDAFLSSHLVFSSDEYLVAGQIRRVRSRTIANCLYRRGRMVEEWVVRDTLAQALQHGLDPDEAARSMTFRGFRGSWLDPAPKDPLAEGDSGPRPDDHRAECEMVLEMIEEVWNGRHLNQVGRFFHRDLFLDTVGDVTITRPDGYQRDLLTLLSAFPTAQFEVRDIQTNHAERYAGLRIAVLWKLVGGYDGRALFGPLTGKPVDLMGVSQFLVHDGRIVREKRIYDDLALRAQINSTRGDEPVANTNIY